MASISAADAKSPPDTFFMDPSLPVELCWKDESDPVKVERYQCWADRFPELGCAEIFLLEDFSWNASEFLVNTWRRFIPWGMGQKIAVLEEPDGGMIRTTRLDRRSLSLTFYENLDGQVERLEYDRWVLGRWIPWLETEPQTPLLMSSAPSYLKCEPVQEGSDFLFQLENEL